MKSSPHPGTPGSTVGAPPTSYPGLAATPDTDGPIKIERLGTTASKYNLKKKIDLRKSRKI